jgi:hypothetical protein
MSSKGSRNYFSYHEPFRKSPESTAPSRWARSMKFFLEIWNCPQFVGFRKVPIGHGGLLPICNRCCQFTEYSTLPYGGHLRYEIFGGLSTFHSNPNGAQGIA